MVACDLHIVFNNAWKRLKEKRAIKTLPSKRSLGMLPLRRDKRQTDISYHLFFYTCTICSITGKQTVRWDLLADSAFEVLRCALIRDNLSTGLLWSPWAENEINAMEMTQLLQHLSGGLIRCPCTIIPISFGKRQYDKNRERKKSFLVQKYILPLQLWRWVISYA